MRREPVVFLRARLVALYSVSLAAVYGSIAAWQPDRLSEPFPLAWPPFVLAAAALGGAAVFDRLAGLADRHVRSRIRSVAGIVYGGALFLICLGLIAGNRSAAEGGVSLLRAFQPAFLLLAGFGRGYLGALINAFVLTATSVLAGGPGAAISVTLHGGLVAFFLAADHACRQLSEYPVDALPKAGPLLARGGIQAAAVASGLSAWFAFFPARPYTLLLQSGAVPNVPADRLAGLIGNLLFIAAISAVAVYLALRWSGSRRGADADAPVVAIVEARRRPEKPAAPGYAEPPPSLKEWRSRIVKLYVRTTEQLARWGRRRRSFQTALEYARTLSPAGAAAELTEIFTRARYGREELTEVEFDRATRASREILDHHRGKNRES
jgi:hypothetical protein